MYGNKATIRDIADKVSVSKTTVALALADKYGVNEQTKAKILLAAHELGYNFSKIKKKQKKNSNLIKLVIPDKVLYGRNYWTEIIEAIEKECFKAEVSLDIFIFTGDKSIIELYKEIVIGKYVGIIIVDNCFNFDSIIPADKGIPTVLVDPRDYFGNNLSQVRANNYIGGYTAGNYFWEKGHRKLCFLGNISFGSSFRMRYVGFYDSFLNNNDGSGEFFKLTNAEPGQPNWQHSGNAVRQQFQSENRPTAIFCGNDSIALSTIEQLKKEFGLNAGTDYSIIGFDNIEQSMTSVPPLTTIHVDKEEIGRTAVRLLMEEIKDRDSIKKCIEIYGKFIERESSKEIKL